MITGNSTIKAFHGLRDGKEDPVEHLDNIEFAYTSDYTGSIASNKEAHQARPTRFSFISI